MAAVNSSAEHARAGTRMENLCNMKQGRVVKPALTRGEVLVRNADIVRNANIGSQGEGEVNRTSG